MRKILACLISLWVAIPVAYAENTPPPPKKLEAGTLFTVPEAGWFFTVEAEKKLRLRLLDADYFEKAFQLEKDIVQSVKTQLEVQQQISDRYRSAWLESDKSLTEALKRESSIKFWYMTLGVVLTIGAGCAIAAAGNAF